MDVLEGQPTAMFWVVGDDTNVGKTFISTGLIRLMNSRGIRTAGFKPYVGAALKDVVDLLEETAGHTPHQLAGYDARRIAAASPLTPENLLEVVNPSWRIHHPSRSETVLVRKGSTLLGDRRLLKTRNTERFFLREDIRDLSEHLKLPFESAEAIADGSADSIDALGQHSLAKAFACLRSLQPDAIVCEGAGRLLPVWAGCPPIRHLLLVSRGNLYFFANIRLNIKLDRQLEAVPTVLALVEHLKRRRCTSSPIPVLSKRDRESRLERFLERVVIGAWDNEAFASP